MDVLKLETIEAAGVGHTLLEGPHWDTATQSLYYVDITECFLFRFDYRQNKVYKAIIDGEEKTPLHHIIPVEGQPDHFVVAARTRLLLINWNGKSVTAKKIRVLTEVQRDVPGMTINDGKADPRGRLYAGTFWTTNPFESTTGIVFRFANGKVTQLKAKVGLSNGLAWNEDGNKFYYIDTLEKNVKEYDYSPETGDITNERIVVSLGIEGDLYFDGMTIDSNGLLYVAGIRMVKIHQEPVINGGRLFVVDPAQKKVVREIMFPVNFVTSAAFGGPNMDELFVTTGCFSEAPSPAGALFRIKGLGVKGTKMHKVRI